MITVASARRTSTATTDAYFERWVDHATWPEWDPDTDWVRLDGPIELGATGKLKPSGGPTVRFTITTLEPGSATTAAEYTDTSRLPGSRLRFRHRAVPTINGCALEIDVWFEGVLAPLWARILGADFARTAPAGLDRLVALVEEPQPARN